MGATYFFLADASLLVTGYWGRTDPSASQQVRDARAADPSRKLARAHVIDLSFLEGTTASPASEAETFRGLASSYLLTFGPLPTAVIATTPHIFGLARVFEIAAGVQVPPVPVRAVRSWDEAARFLGLDLTEAESELRRRREAAEQ